MGRMKRWKRCWLWRDLYNGESPLILVWFSYQVEDYQFGPGYVDLPAKQQVKRDEFRFEYHGLLGRVGVR